MDSIFSFIIHHFSHVAPILTAGALGLWIIIERAKALYRDYPFPYMDSFFERLRTLIVSDRLVEALTLCDKFPERPVMAVVKEGLLRAHLPENLIEQGLQIAVGKASERIQARTAFLSTIANVATLLGLLGTILGLVQSFEAVGSATSQQRSALLAMGISTAMNATMLGLGVAIPCMVAFSFLINRTNQLIAQVDQAANLTLDLLKQRYYSVEPQKTEFTRASKGDAGRLMAMG